MLLVFPLIYSWSITWCFLQLLNQKLRTYLIAKLKPFKRMGVVNIKVNDFKHFTTDMASPISYPICIHRNKMEQLNGYFTTLSKLVSPYWHNPICHPLIGLEHFIFLINSSLAMLPTWYHIKKFYFTNHLITHFYVPLVVLAIFGYNPIPSINSIFGLKMCLRL